MIELKHVELDEKYRKKWNETSYDFVHLYVDGVKVSDTYYRVGGFGGDIKERYFLLLKYVEALYDDSITTDPNGKQHLAGCWCILNQEGVEKAVFDQFTNVYLTGGILYSVDRKYHNIETGELYCTSYTLMQSKEYIFLDNAYDKDKTKRGVYKINKKDGTYEIFS